MVSRCTLLSLSLSRSLSCFSGDHPKVSSGLADIVTDFNAFHAASGFAKGCHHYTNRILDIAADGQSCHASWYGLARFRRISGEPFEFNGDYDAQLVKLDGLWKIASCLTKALL